MLLQMTQRGKGRVISLQPCILASLTQRVSCILSVSWFLSSFHSASFSHLEWDRLRCKEWLQARGIKHFETHGQMKEEVKGKEEEASGTLINSSGGKLLILTNMKSLKVRFLGGFYKNKLGVPECDAAFEDTREWMHSSRHDRSCT